MERLLILNPGSTSTKIAVYDAEKPLFTESIVHTPAELAPFDRVADQYEFRKELVLKCLGEHGVALDSLSAVVSRGGLLTPIEAGAYEVNDDMVWQLKNKPQNEHASNVGAMIARSISLELNIPAYIYDGVTVDELTPINKRAGGLPMFDVIKMCFSGEYTYQSMMKLVKNQGGLMAHLGTTDSRDVEKKIAEGDTHAKLIYDAMALNVAKNIGKLAPGVYGKLDAILLTGGIAYSEYFTKAVTEYVSFLAPVVVYGGENEMESLALGGLRVLRGQEKAKTFVKTEEPGF